MSESRKPLILHLTADYPNVHNPHMTHAIRDFIALNPQFDRFVIALNRTANPLRAREVDGDGLGDDKVISKRYWGLPLGVLLALSMYLAARDIRRIIRERNLRVDAIHAHKLTFEGIMGWFLSRWLGVPLFASTRGEADIKILRFKPHYRPLIQSVIDRCAHIYHISAWFQPIMEARFRTDPARQSLIPNFIRADTIEPGTVFRTDRYLTVARLNIWRKKGLDRLLPAFRSLLADYPDAHLDIAGRGTDEDIAELKALIARHGLGERVHLLGPVPNGDLMARLPDYCAMVMPSHNETFGMIYVEALHAGVPILFSRGTGIDGFIEDLDVGVGVDPTDLEDITRGLHTLARDQQGWRTRVLSQIDVVRERFRPEPYVTAYRAHVAEALEARMAFEHRGDAVSLP